MADTVDHTHGDTGTKPADGLNFANGDLPDPEVFDWFWTEVPNAINNHADRLEAIDSDGDGAVDRADVADSADTVKGNDIDNDGDGKVNSAEQADEAAVAQQAITFPVRNTAPSNPTDGEVWILSNGT